MPVRPGAEAGRQRLVRLARALYEGEKITARHISTRYGVCISTAKADMRLLRMYLPLRIRRIPRGPENRAIQISLARRARRA